MGCTYIYNGEKYDSYQELVSSLADEDMSKLADILFSKQNKQDAVYDRLQSLKISANLNTDNTQIIDGSPDIEHWRFSIY